MPVSNTDVLKSKSIMQIMGKAGNINMSVMAESVHNFSIDTSSTKEEDRARIMYLPQQDKKRKMSQ
jgi:hypothetical protein